MATVTTAETIAFSGRRSEVRDVDSLPPVLGLVGAATAINSSVDRLRHAIRERPAVRVLFHTVAGRRLIERGRLNELAAAMSRQSTVRTTITRTVRKILPGEDGAEGAANAGDGEMDSETFARLHELLGSVSDE